MQHHSGNDGRAGEVDVRAVLPDIDLQHVGVAVVGVGDGNHLGYACLGVEVKFGVDGLLHAIHLIKHGRCRQYRYISVCRCPYGARCPLK